MPTPAYWDTKDVKRKNDDDDDVASLTNEEVHFQCSHEVGMMSCEEGRCELV